MNIVDAIIILFLMSGVVLGFKKGAIRSLVTLIGTIILVIVSYYLKDPVANVLFKYLPFLNFSGSFEGLVSLNILVYEAIAYVLVFVVLSSVLSLLIKISGIIEKILNATIILGIPSKILGAILGFIEAVVFSFIVLFVLLQFNGTQNFIRDSKVAITIINKTPFIGNMVKDTYNAIDEIYALQDKYKDQNNKDEYNGEILKIMLSKKIISKKDALKLVEDDKLKFEGAKEIINNWGDEIND